MARKLTKEQFETLPDFIKEEYEQSGDGFQLKVEDVEGLKRSKAEILAEKKRIQDELEELKKFKTEFESSKTAEEEENLKKAGEFAELETKLRAKISELETAHAEEKKQLFNNIKTERLTNELVKRGVMADRAKYALADIADEIELASSERGFELKVKNGIGDAKEFDALLDGMKQKSPFFFAASTASGSGASGSEGTGGNAKQITRADWEKMSPNESSAFFSGGGKITD